MSANNPLRERLLAARRKTLAGWIQRRDEHIAIRDKAEAAVQRAVKQIENINDEIEMLLDSDE